MAALRYGGPVPTPTTYSGVDYWWDINFAIFDQYLAIMWETIQYRLENDASTRSPRVTLIFNLVTRKVDRFTPCPASHSCAN